MSSSGMDMADPKTYVPLHDYASHHLRERSFLDIPTPDLEFSDGDPMLHLTDLKPYEYSSSEYGNPAFLRGLFRASSLRLPHTGFDWSYEQRRTAQKILPFLFLGPSTVAKDVSFVRGEAITLLVAVRSALAARTRASLLDPSTFASSSGIETLTLDLDSSYDLMTKLPETIKAINMHIERSCNSHPPLSLGEVPARVMLFCESGNERSATVAAAYLMATCGMSVVQAIQMVQSQRFCIVIEEGMKHMLSTFEDLLQAKRDVETADRLSAKYPPSDQDVTQEKHGPTEVQGLRNSTKRTIHSMYDSDEEGGSEEPAGISGGSAPFQDALG